MNAPGRTSKLDPYREEILALRRHRKTYQDIVRHLAKEHGVQVAISTLSGYLDTAEKGVPPPSSPPKPIPPELENFLGQAEVFAELQTSTRMVVDRIGDLIEGIQALNREGQQRHEVMTSTLQALRERSPNRAVDLAPLELALAEQTEMLRRLTERQGTQIPAVPPSTVAVPVQTIRRIWRRAFLVSGLLWAAIAILFLAYGPTLARTLILWAQKSGAAT